MTQGQPASSERKGLHPLAWVAIGCLGLMVVIGGIVVMAGVFVANKVGEMAQDIEENPVEMTARLIAAANPDIELVEADDERRRVIFRNVKTGEELVFDFEDIEEGRLSFSAGDETAELTFDPAAEGEGSGGLTITTDEGTARFGATSPSDFPEWLPVYPGSEPEGNFAASSDEGRMGIYTLRTTDSMEDVTSFYGRELVAKGLAVRVRTETPQGVVLMTATEDESRTVNVAISREGSEVECVVNFAQK